MSDFHSHVLNKEETVFLLYIKKRIIHKGYSLQGEN